MIKPGMYIGDRYEIIDKVGSGGMADVYKALCHKLNRYVAVKVLKQEFSTDEGFVDKFRAEAQSAAGLSHPNIVNVYDVGEENGIYYIVMELIEGITLKNFIERKGRLDIREATGIAIQIAQGLEAAHANNIIHRDIKPQNIIISKEGKVKVADFGIAKAASSNTLTSSAMGSVHYISPEQARGGYSDEKSDIYSLGITIYEMILGRVPFEGDNAVSIALLHIQEEPRTLGEMLPGMPRSVDRIVQKCLQKKPERRYLSVIELAEDLKRSLVEPNGDFVFIPDTLNNSPTIALSQDDVNAIRSGALQAELNNANNMMNQPTGMDYNGRYQENYNNDYNDYSESSTMSDMERYDDNYIDEEEQVDNKLEKITKVGAIIIVILIIGIIIFIFISNSKNKGNNENNDPKATELASLEGNDTGKEYLIDVTQMQEADAKAKLQEVGFNNVKVVYYDLENEEEGNVFSQDPGISDSRIPTDTLITLYVKKTGAEKQESNQTAIIPSSIKGKTEEEARKILQDLFKNNVIQFMIEVESIEDTSNSVEEGKVFKTSPSIGKEIKNNSDSKVILFVNKKSDMIEVPNIIGKTKQQAALILQREGLELDLSNIQYDEDDTSVNINEVCEQMPAGGSKVSRGDKVKVIIRKEKKPDRPEVVKKNYKIKVTLDGKEATNPFIEPAEGMSSTGSLKAILTINGKQYYPPESYSIDYATFGTKTYDFEFSIYDYEGELSVSISAIDYVVSGNNATDITPSENNTRVATILQ